MHKWKVMVPEYYLDRVLVVCVTVSLCISSLFAANTDLLLATDGAANYVVVKPGSPTAVDDYAINVLTNFLRKKTAIFPVVAPEELEAGRKAIFVGLSNPALKGLDKNPIPSMQDQDHVTRSIGENIYLYGKGLHGNLYAVLDFMEQSLGRRWFSRFEEPVAQPERDLVLEPFERRKSVSFPYRQGLWHCLEFCYQHGINVRFSQRQARYRELYGKTLFPPGVVSSPLQIGGVHSLHQYIPPTPESHLWPQYQWIEKRDYFQTHPEFFTMNRVGKRVPNRQLCFSNPGLRKEFSKNVLEHIRRDGESIFVTFGAEDNGSAFCECAECRAQEETYSSPGGPYYDYMLELAELLKNKHPNTTLKILAYRRKQTQHPPTMPSGVTFPNNIYVVFAHVEDALSVDWEHPANEGTYKDLVAWCKLTPHVLVWSYPVPYGKGVNLPFSNTGRLVQTIRAMKQAGVEGVYQEYATDRVHYEYGFSELHIYLYYKLAMDVETDVPTLVREFTDHQYGAAAPLVRRYLDELEKAVAAGTPPITLSPVSYEFFSYLTAERVHRWQQMFDRMEADTAENPRCLANVRRLRRNLEFAALLRWSELAKEYPDEFSDYTVHEKRITDQGKHGAAEMADLITIVKAGGESKPLPPEFDGIDPSRIRQFIPENRGQGSRASKHKTLLDPDSAFGYGATVYRGYDRDLPFAFGFYQNRIGATEAPWGTPGAQRELNLDDITPGIYRLYKLGTIEVTASCRIWLQINQGWATVLDLGTRLHDPANPAPEDNRWDAYVSLKFDGPAYGGKAAENSVLCDRIILAEKAKE